MRGSPKHLEGLTDWKEIYKHYMKDIIRNQIVESAIDLKTELQARAIANDCYKYIMDLYTNVGIVSDT